MVDRRVHDGALGCPNCRDAFPVADGFGDLRAPPRRELPPGLAGEPREPDAEAVGRLAALLGVVRGPGTLVLAGEPAALGPGLGELIDDVHVVGLDADLAAWSDTPKWSRLVSRPGLPFFSRSLRGVAVDGRLGPDWTEEAARVCAPLSRVVVTSAPEAAAAILVESGLEVLVDEDSTVVATRS